MFLILPSHACFRVWIVGTGLVLGGSDAEAIGLVLLFAYGVFCFALLARGQSYGRWILGMRAYRVTGRPAGFFIMLVRETRGKFVSGLMLSLGYLWLLWDRDRQTWHDKMVGTVILVRR